MGVKQLLGTSDDAVPVVQLDGRISSFPTYTGSSVYGNRSAASGAGSIPSSAFRSTGRSTGYSGYDAPARTISSSMTSGSGSMHVYTTSSASYKSIGGGGSGSGSASVGSSSSSSNASYSSSVSGSGVVTLAMVSSSNSRSTMTSKQQAAMAYEAAMSGSTEYGSVASPVVRNAPRKKHTSVSGTTPYGCDDCAINDCITDGHALVWSEDDQYYAYICTGDSNCQCYCGCGCPVGGPILPMLLMLAIYTIFITLKKKFTPREEE